MANTEPFYWYQRNKGKNGYIGIVDSEGDAPETAALNIDIWYDKIPDEITSDNDTIPLGDEWHEGFLKGVVYEYLMMQGVERRAYLVEYQETVNRAKSRVIVQTMHPLRVIPMDIRLDTQGVNQSIARSRSGSGTT